MLESGPAGIHYGTKRVARVIKEDVRPRFYEPTFALCRFMTSSLIVFLLFFLRSIDRHPGVNAAQVPWVSLILSNYATQ